MSAIIRGDFRSLHYLLALGGIAAATATVIYVVAFLWHGPSHPAARPADPVPPTQALEPEEGVPPPPEASNTARSPSAGSPVEDIAASPTPVAPSNRQALASMPFKTALSRPGRNTHTKKAGVGRHHQDQMIFTLYLDAKPRDQRSALCRQPGEMGPLYGDQMPAPDLIQAAGFTALPTSKSDT